MAKKPETLFKEKVVKRLHEEFGHSIYLFKTQQVSLRGIPDLVGSLKGSFFAWELKSGSNSASPLQEHELGRIRASGGLGAVVHPDNFEDQLRLLKSWVDW